MTIVPECVGSWNKFPNWHVKSTLKSAWKFHFLFDPCRGLKKDSSQSEESATKCETLDHSVDHANFQRERDPRHRVAQETGLDEPMLKACKYFAFRA